MDDLETRLLELGIAIVELFRRLPSRSAFRRIGREAVRTTSMAGDRCRETRRATNRDEFVRCVKAIAHQMAECLYWLRLVHGSGGVSVKPLLREADAIIAILLDAARRGS